MTSLLKQTLLGLGLLAGLGACKYEPLAPADYPQQILYMPTARNGIYTINSLPPTVGTGAFRFSVNLADKKLIVPLGVFRGGVSSDGAVPVTITANADTLAKLITANTLTGTVVMPKDKYSLPTDVTLEDGKDAAPFALTLDLDYLRSVTAGQRVAVAVTIGSTGVSVNPLLKTTVVLIDPAILKPVPTFTSRVDATTPRRIIFTNTSKNALSYLWDFGDGSATVTDAAPAYTYSKAGTFTVKLTATGITGGQDTATQSTTVTVP